MTDPDNHSPDAEFAMQIIRAEALEHITQPVEDDNYAEAWPKPSPNCLLAVYGGTLISCPKHGYRHLQRVVNPLQRYSV